MHDQKLVCPVWSQDSKIYSIKNRWNELNWTVIYRISILFAVFLHKSYIGIYPIYHKSCSGYICQNTLSQLDCRILKLTISSEQIDEKALFFACWYRVGKFRFSGAQNSVLLKVSSGKRRTPHNFVLLETLRVLCVCLMVYLVVLQMK